MLFSVSSLVPHEEWYLTAACSDSVKEIIGEIGDHKEIEALYYELTDSLPSFQAANASLVSQTLRGLFSLPHLRPALHPSPPVFNSSSSAQFRFLA